MPERRDRKKKQPPKVDRKTKKRRVIKGQKLEIPLMNTVENGMRLILDCFVASDEICTDDYQFSYESLQRMAGLKHAVVPVFNNFDENQKIGSCRPSGIHVNGETNLLLANCRLFIEKDFAAKISENREKLAFVPSVKVTKKSTYEDDDDVYHVIEKADLLSVNLVLAKNAVDPNCKILTVLKDSDIDKRLEDD